VGDDEFRELYVRTNRQLFLFALHRLSPEQAKDAVSDTFEVAWRKRESGPSEPSEWPAWLFGIIKNQILQEVQRVRRKHHDNRFVDDTPHLTKTREPDIADSVTMSDSARRIWSLLTPAEQNLLNVAFLGNLEKAQAAQRLGISVTAYTTRVTRLRQRIASLDDAGNEPVTSQEVGRS
jgi:RNA polymerase sigma-70 factor (ECF subfamily)